MWPDCLDASGGSDSLELCALGVTDESGVPTDLREVSVDFGVSLKLLCIDLVLMRILGLVPEVVDKLDGVILLCGVALINSLILLKSDLFIFVITKSSRISISFSPSSWEGSELESESRVMRGRGTLLGATVSSCLEISDTDGGFVVISL